MPSTDLKELKLSVSLKGLELNLRIPKMDSKWQLTYHWAASSYSLTDHIIKSYHFIIGHDGEIHHGRFKPEANRPIPIPLRMRSNYAAHCGGENSWNIGISYLGMAGYSAKTVSPYPITEAQAEVGFRLGAQLSMQYEIPITPERIRTHYEVGMAHRKAGRISPSVGKIDIVHLPYKPELKAGDVGAYIRGRIRAYELAIKEGDHEQHLELPDKG